MDSLIRIFKIDDDNTDKNFSISNRHEPQREFRGTKRKRLDVSRNNNTNSYQQSEFEKDRSKVETVHEDYKASQEPNLKRNKEPNHEDGLCSFEQCDCSSRNKEGHLKARRKLEYTQESVWYSCDQCNYESSREANLHNQSIII